MCYISPSLLCLRLTVHSIVAVHRLNGDLKNTWTDKKIIAFQFKDFLPHDVPNARVITFRYHTDTVFGNTAVDIVDHVKNLHNSLVDKREGDNMG